MSMIFFNFKPLFLGNDKNLLHPLTEQTWKSPVDDSEVKVKSIRKCHGIINNFWKLSITFGIHRYLLEIIDKL